MSISLARVSFRYETADRPAVHGLNLTIATGEVVALSGPSGCGKTTLVRLLNGLIPHFHGGELSGRVLVEGAEPAGQQIWETAGRVGSVFQNPRTQFFTTDTTSEIAFGCENLGLDEATTRSRVAAAVEAFGLGSLRDRSVFALSGGERQRLACAAVTAVRPGVFALDEPSANLDEAATGHLRRIMAAWKESGATVVVAEHRLGYLRELADRLILLDHGRIVADYRGDEFRAMDDAALRALGLRTADAARSLRRSTTVPGPPVLGRATPGQIPHSPALHRLAVNSSQALEIQDLRYQHIHRTVPGTDGGPPPQPLQIDRLGFPIGRVTALIGPNGVGKTTLLRWLTGTLRARTGRLLLAGHNLRRRDRRRRVFGVSQDVNHELFTESAAEEISLTLRLRGLRGGVSAECARILELVDLAELAGRHPMSLSEGEKQRLAIGAALASQRQIGVLDEPTSGLDLWHMEQVASALRQLADTGCTVIVATHDSELIEACADQVVELSPGPVTGSVPG